MSNETPKFVPTFNLDATNLDIKSDAELASAIEKEGRRGFEVGNYDLKITNPRFHANKITGLVTCAKDPTWFNVAVTLESADGERSKDYFIQVPTTKVKYKGANGKEGLFVFKKFTEFMMGVGETVSVEQGFLQKLVAKYFGSEEAMKKYLDGKTVNIDMGYSGPHAQKVEDEQFKIVLKSGDYQEDGQTILFPDFQSAKVFAQAKEIELSYVEVVKITSAVKAVKTDSWE